MTIMDEEIKRLALKTSDANQINNLAICLGMTTLLQSGAEKVLQGVITLEEELSVTRIAIKRETGLEA